MTQQQKIQNPEMQIQKTPQMNDRDFINDQLATEKYMTNSYNIALNEASHDSYIKIFHPFLTKLKIVNVNYTM